MGELRARDHKRHPQPTSRDSKLEIKNDFSTLRVYAKLEITLCEHLLELHGSLSLKVFLSSEQTLQSSTKLVGIQTFSNFQSHNSPSRGCVGLAGSEGSRKISTDARCLTC